jgi:hypothetical protein
MPEEILKKVYEGGSKYYDLDDYDTFKRKMQDPAIRRKVYDGLSQYYQLDDFAKFETDIGIQAKPKESEKDIGFFKAVGKALYPTRSFSPEVVKKEGGDIISLNTVGETALNALMLLSDYIPSSFFPTRSGPYKGVKETIPQAIARRKERWETLSPEELQTSGQAFHYAQGGVVQPLSPEMAEGVGKQATEFIADPLWIPGIKITKAGIGAISRAMKAMKAGKEADAIRIIGKIEGVTANQADEYVKFWTAPENKAKLDEAEAIVNKRAFDAEKVGKPELEALNERLRTQERLTRLGKQTEEMAGSRVILGPNEERITIRPDGSRIIRDKYGNLIEEIPSAKATPEDVAVREKLREAAVREKKPEAPTPLEQLTTKVKAGEATGEEIKTFVKESEPATVEKAEQILRKAHKEAKTPEEGSDIANGIDVLTQASGKKPKVPTPKAPPKKAPISKKVEKEYQAGRASAEANIQERGEQFARNMAKKPGYGATEEIQAYWKGYADVLDEARAPAKKVATKGELTPYEKSAKGAPSGAQKVTTAIGRDPNLRLLDSEIEGIYGKGTKETEDLIRKIGGGKRTLDDVSRELQEAGTIAPAPQDYNSQHLINLITEDAPTVAKAERQAEKAAEQVFGKTAKKAPKVQERPTPPTPTGAKENIAYNNFKEGDKFTVDGEEFTVTSKMIENDGEVVGVRLKDRKNYEQDLTDWKSGVDIDEGSLKKAGAEPTPAIELTAFKPNPKLPDWLNDAMLREGKNPNRPFNEIDITNKSVRDAIEADPSLTRKEKDSLLKTGSRQEPTPAPKAETPAKPEIVEPEQAGTAKQGVLGEGETAPTPKAEPIEQVTKGKKEFPKNFRELLPEEQGALVVDTLEKGEIIKVGNTEYKITSKTPKKITIKNLKTGKSGTIYKWGNQNVAWMKTKNDGTATGFFRDIESDITRSLISEKNIFGQVKTEAYNRAIKRFDELKSQAKPKAEPTPIEQVTKGKELKEGESIPLQRGTKEFTEQQAKAGKKPAKLTKQQKKEKFAKKLEEGEYKGDMFVEEGKARQTSLLEKEKPTPLEQVAKPTAELNYADRWNNSLKLGRKVELVKGGKWVTNKGGLSKLGEKIAESKWEDISPAAQKVLQREIDKFYKTAKATPVEQLTAPKQTFRQFVESKGVEWDQVSGARKDEVLRQRLFDEFQGKKPEKVNVTFTNLQEIPGSKKATIMVDLPSKTTVGYDASRHILSDAEKAKLNKAIQKGGFEGAVEEPEFLLMMKDYKPKKAKTGKEFAEGLLDAAKKDIFGQELGITPDPYRNLKKFLDENKLRLTDAERKKLMDFASGVAKRGLLTAEKRQQLIDEYIAKNFTRTPEGIPTAKTGETPLERLTKTEPITPAVTEATEGTVKKVKPKTFRQLENKWKQPMGEGKPTTPGYNVEKMHPALKDELPQIIENFREEFNLMRGERLTTEQAIDSAIKFAGNLTDDAVMTLKRSDVTNASHLLGARIYVNNRLLEISDKLAAIPKDASGKLIGEITAENKHVLDMYMKVRSLGTETARALRFMQIPMGDNLINGMKKYRDVLAKIDPKSAKVLSDVIADAEKLPTKTDAILFWWYNGMLSNPFTDLANITGNASHLTWEIMTNMAHKPSSIKQMFKGLWEGSKEGVKQAKAIYNQEKELLSKFSGDIGRARYDVYPKTKVGKFLRSTLPTTRLAMEDAIFSNMAKQMRIGVESPILAKKFGTTVDDVLETVKNVIENPEFVAGANDKVYRDLAEYAEKYAEYLTFRTPLKSKFMQGAQQTLWVKPFIPFPRVMANIAKAGFKNSPAGIIKFFGKDAKTLSAFERQDIARRALAGTAVFSGLGTMMAAGKIEITGSGPESKKERELWDKMGYKPNHIYIVDGDGSKTGISYQNINPFNVILAVMGNWQDQYRFGNKLTDDEKTLTERLSYALAGAAATMTDQSFMQGISNLYDWIRYKDEGYLEDFFTKPFIPNIVGFPRNLREYVSGEKPRYEARTWWERLKRRVGLYEGLIPTYSAYGGQKESGYERFPYFPTDIERDPLLENLRGKNALISVPSKNTSINNRKITDKEYSDYVKFSGNEIISKLRQNQNEILKMNAEDTQDYIDNIVRNARRNAKETIENRSGGALQQLTKPRSRTRPRPTRPRRARVR